MTLIEVMVALGVMCILVSGIFFVVQTSLKTVIMVDTAASRQDEITNLVDILRNGFRNLPVRTQIVAKPLVQDGTEQIVLVFRDAPGFLSWLSEKEADNLIVLLAFRRDDEGAGWRVCMKRFVPPEHFSENEFDAKKLLALGAKIPWLERVGDFRRVGVRFFDAEKDEWLDAWNNPKERPSLIELKLVSEKVRDARSESSVLWVPPVRSEVASR